MLMFFGNLGTSVIIILCLIGLVFVAFPVLLLLILYKIFKRL